jgi:hypothetical protein
MYMQSSAIFRDLCSCCKQTFAVVWKENFFFLPPRDPTSKFLCRVLWVILLLLKSVKRSEEGSTHQNFFVSSLKEVFKSIFSDCERQVCPSCD